jgi:cell growth-regulating nucleolar protein
MVWFQCESCGENLKKPKLQNHFRGCAARKLSCIDCGVVFDQQSVQVHTSCVSETEKYGPKDGSNSSVLKLKSSQAHRAGDVDLSIGLSTHAPWNCSLCKVNATSYETLEGHSQGKKHRAKAKAAQAKLNPPTVVERDLTASSSLGNGIESSATAAINCSEPVEDSKALSDFAAEEGSSKKRKAGDGEKKSDVTRKKSIKGEGRLDAAAHDVFESSENGCEEKLNVESSAASVSHSGKVVKWKKLTTKVLLKTPENSIKIKELLKEILPLVTSGAVGFDKKTLEKQMVETLNGSSKFDVRGKWVALATPS